MACRSFLAAGLPIPVAASACATALRKMCEDVSSIATEPTTFEGLIRVGEVSTLNFWLYFLLHDMRVM